MIENKRWVYFGNGNKINNRYWHTWDWQRLSKLNNNNRDVQTLISLPKWFERGRQVINCEWILGMKINDTIIILNGSPRMHSKNYLSINLRLSTNFSSGSIYTQIVWRSLFCFQKFDAAGLQFWCQFWRRRQWRQRRRRQQWQQWRRAQRQC